jgi:GT2 family glycosyltransferase
MCNELSIIIVNWNTSELLKQCLESLRRCKIGLNNIIVVDNASNDLSVNMVESQFPEVMLIKNSQNLGFAKANNIAIGKSVADYICLLNSDTVVSPECFIEMLSFMTVYRDAVACAPALRLPSGRLQTGGAGYELSLVTAFNFFFFLTKLFPLHFKGIYLEQSAYVKLKKPLKVDWLAGTCLMVRKEAVDAVGGLDESYFMYAEDAEWCDRLRKYGNIYYLPYLEIIHYQGASSEQSDKVPTNWLAATFSYFSSKHKSKVELFRIFAALGFLMRSVLYGALRFTDREYACKSKAMLKYFLYTIRWRQN